MKASPPTCRVCLFSLFKLSHHTPSALSQSIYFCRGWVYVIVNGTPGAFHTDAKGVPCAAVSNTRGHDKASVFDALGMKWNKILITRFSVVYNHVKIRIVVFLLPQNEPFIST